MISTKIKKLRELKGLSQEYMAIGLDITQGAYSKLERSDKGISIDKLKGISELLEVDAMDFFKSSEEVVFNNNECEKFGYNYINNFPKKLIQILENQIEEQKKEIDLLRKIVDKNL